MKPAPVTDFLLHDLVMSAAAEGAVRTAVAAAVTVTVNWAAGCLTLFSGGAICAKAALAAAIIQSTMNNAPKPCRYAKLTASRSFLILFFNCFNQIRRLF